MEKKIIFLRFLLCLELSLHNNIYASEAEKPSTESTTSSEPSGSSSNGEADGVVSGEKELEASKRMQLDMENYFFKNSVFRLAPFYIPIFSNKEVVSTVQIEASMETTEEEWDHIRIKIPILYHHLFVDLYQSLNFLWDRLNPPTSEVLKSRFMTVANRVLGEGKIKKVFIILIAVTDR